MTSSLLDLSQMVLIPVNALLNIGRDYTTSGRIGQTRKNKDDQFLFGESMETDSPTLTSWRDYYIDA